MIGVLSVLSVFMLCIVTLVLVGAKSYEAIQVQMDTNFQERTVVAYITNKVRQNDYQSAVEVRKVEGRDILVLSEWLEEIKYETWIYALENSLYELYIEAGTEVDLADGIRLLEIQTLSIQRDGDLLHFKMAQDTGDLTEWKVRLRSEEGVR